MQVNSSLLNFCLNVLSDLETVLIAEANNPVPIVKLIIQVMSFVPGPGVIIDCCVYLINLGLRGMG